MLSFIGLISPSQKLIGSVEPDEVELTTTMHCNSKIYEPNKFFKKQITAGLTAMSANRHLKMTANICKCLQCLEFQIQSRSFAYIRPINKPY